MLDGLADGGLHLAGLPGLGEVAEHVAFVDRVHHGLDVGVAGEQEPGGVGPELLDLAEEAHARHLGHSLVRQDDRRLDVGHGRERLGAGEVREDVVLAAELVVERFEDGCLVVDHDQRRTISTHAQEVLGTQIKASPGRTA